MFNETKFKIEYVNNGILELECELSEIQIQLDQLWNEMIDVDFYTVTTVAFGYTPNVIKSWLSTRSLSITSYQERLAEFLSDHPNTQSYDSFSVSDTYKEKYEKVKKQLEELRNNKTKIESKLAVKKTLVEQLIALLSKVSDE